MAAIVFGFIFGVIAACVLGIKCIRRRQNTRQIKDQMQLKKYQFATQLGMNVYELDGRMLGQTIHL
jgi:membrane carboxypeptidase/penicillin-binding protein